MAQDSGAPVIEGTLAGHDDTAIPISHVHILPYDNDRTRSISVGPDDTFRASLDTTGVVTLHFTGHNHKMKETTIVVHSGDTTGVDVRLGTFAREDNPDFRVFGEFNDFSHEDGTISMERRDDATFVATVPSPDDSLTYGVLGAHPDGPHFDRLEYAGNGDYRPVIATPQDSTEIAYDPAAVPRSDAESHVQFRDSTSLAAQYAAFLDRLTAQRQAYSEEMQTAAKAAKRDSSRTVDEALGVVRDTFDWSPTRKQLEHALSQDHPSVVENAFLMAPLSTGSNVVDSALAQKMLSSVSPSSPLWTFEKTRYAYGFGNMSRAIQITDQVEDYFPYAYEAMRTHPSERLQADLLLSLLRWAKENGDLDRQRMFYSWLHSEHPNRTHASIAKRKYNPTQNLEAGEPVPDFNVQSLQDTTRVFTPDDFTGQYLLLDFWATWCMPCIDAIPTLREAHERYGETVTILAISLDDERSTVQQFLKERALPWQHAFDAEGLQGKLAQTFQLRGVPTYVLVDPEGQVVSKGTGKPALSEILDDLSEISASSADAP